MNWRFPGYRSPIFIAQQHLMIAQVSAPCRTRRVKEGLCGSAALRPADPIPRGSRVKSCGRAGRPVPVLSEPGRDVDKAPQLQLRLGSGCRITRADHETLRQEPRRPAYADCARADHRDPLDFMLRHRPSSTVIAGPLDRPGEPLRPPISRSTKGATS